MRAADLERRIGRCICVVREKLGRISRVTKSLSRKLTIQPNLVCAGSDVLAKRCHVLKISMSKLIWSLGKNVRIYDK